MRKLRLLTGVACGLVWLVTVGCTGMPKLKPDHVGMADLPLQTIPDTTLPSAVELPKRSDLKQVAGGARPAYRVGPGDILIVNVWGRPDLGSQVPLALDGELRGTEVRSDGLIFLPFIGELAVAGQTTVQVREQVQTAYARLIENPQVEVELYSCRSQSVVLGGAVARPGMHFICDDLQTVGELLVAARGLVETADSAHGVLTRSGASYAYNARDLGLDNRFANVILVDGDALHFPWLRERTVHIYGEVLRQGAVDIPSEGMTILDVLSQARGLDVNSAASDRIFLMRRLPSGVVTYRLRLSEVMQGPEIAMHAGDSIFIPSNKLKKWDRWWTKALPFTTIRADIPINDE